MSIPIPNPSLHIQPLAHDLKFQRSAKCLAAEPLSPLLLPAHPKVTGNVTCGIFIKSDNEAEWFTVFISGGRWVILKASLM